MKHFSFKKKLGFFFTIAFIGVASVGILTFSHLTSIVSDIETKADLQEGIQKSDELLNQINRAENHVKSYSLNQSKYDLDQFYLQAKIVDSLLGKFRSISSIHTKYSIELNQLDSLIDLKMKSLNDLLHLKNPTSASEAVDQLIKNIQNSPKKSTDFLQHWFKKKSEVFAQIETEASQIKQEEEHLFEAFKKQELALFSASKFSSNSIRSLLGIIKNKELEVANKERTAASEKLIETNFYLILFSLSICLTLALFAWMSFNYLKQKSNYEAALLKAKKKAEELAESKQNFLANMSHELRTPLNAIIGFTNQLLSTRLEIDQEKKINIVKKSSNHLLYIVNDILDYTKLSANKIKIESVHFSLSEELNYLEAYLEQAAQEKGISHQIEIDNSVPDCLLGDPFRLKQILLNLLSNAVKFTSNGEVSLKVSFESENTLNNLLKFEVKDTGIGISKEQQINIFQPFEQAESSTTRKFGGTGLGLSVCHQLITLLDGSILIESTVDIGTTFIVQLPFKVGNVENLIDEKTQLVAASNQLHNKSVLIVDDVHFNQNILSAILEKHGANVETSNNGKEAIEIIKKKKFDIVLMDIHMPVMDGIEALKIIQKDNLKTTGMVIHAATATNDVEQKRQYLKEGFDQVLSKPFSEIEILNLLTSSKKTAFVSDKKHSRLDFSPIEKMADNNRDFFSEMLNSFLLELENGMKELKEALNKKDYLEVANSAHKMNAPCTFVSAMELHRLLKQIEAESRSQKGFEPNHKIWLALESEMENVISQTNDALKKW